MLKKLTIKANMDKLNILFAIFLFLNSCMEKNKNPELVKKNELNNIKSDSAENYLSQADKNEKENIRFFIPENYTVLDSISGNLNLDNYSDLILVLKKNNEETTSDVIDNPERRPLLILIGDANNKYKLIERNDNSVYCIDCGGMLGDPYLRTVIKEGYFSVEHYGGSSWRWTRIITYKYSKKDNNWFLYKDGGESFNTSEPAKINETIKTTKDFGRVFFKDFNIYAETNE